jgi:hypothetical protein
VQVYAFGPLVAALGGQEVPTMDGPGRRLCPLLVLTGALLTQGLRAEEPIVPCSDGIVAQTADDFERTTAAIEARRVELAARLEHAGPAERASIRDEARKYVVDAIVEQIFPAWLGMPWTMAVIRDGLKPDARVPFEPGKGISCSFFVVSVLENAGLRLAGRRTFAGAVALPIQRSLSPADKDLRRFHGIGPTGLEQKMLAWGDGLYVAGLNCHIGFIVVRDGRVRFVHASYTEPYRVVDEPLVGSAAIENSPGYVVTALYRDDRLIDLWLKGDPVPFRPRRPSK